MRLRRTLLGKEDILRGFKESVITGHLIPAGTGSERFQHLRVEKLGEELPPEVEGFEEENDEIAFEEPRLEDIDFGDDDDELDPEDDAFADFEDGYDDVDFEGGMSDSLDDEFDDSAFASDDDDANF